jgi:excisionase family DNA binding protein
MLTIAETAKALSVSVSTVWRLIRVGRIRPVHPSPGTTRVTERELAAYIASLEGRRVA